MIGQPTSMAPRRGGGVIDGSCRDDVEAAVDPAGADGLVAEPPVQAQIAFAAVTGAQPVALDLRLLGETGLDGAQQPPAEAVPLHPGVDDQLADGGGAVLLHGAAHRADDLAAQPCHQHAGRGELGAQLVEGLGERLDAVVAVQLGLALEAQILEFENRFGVAVGRRRDGHAHAHVRRPP
jgi:hypothetical protein